MRSSTQSNAPLRRAITTVTTAALVATSVIGCGAILGLNDLTGLPADVLGEGGGADGGGDGAGAIVNPDAVGVTLASKVDVLLVVDDSAAMSSKASLLASSLEPFLRQVMATNDVHLGVLSTSLGTMGGVICDDEKTNRHARLSTVGPANVAVAAATATGFLSFNSSGTKAAEDAFVADAKSLVLGMGEQGCNLEAQLESMYHFLVQPDPWVSIKVTAAQQAEYVGIDQDVLVQRKAFLRPDSLVVIVMLTDEDDSTADPRSFGGMGWGFMDSKFPGSITLRADGKTTTAPRPTSACAGDPGSPSCASCACEPSDPACARIKNDVQCSINDGYYGQNEEQLNVRFHRMKQRFGVDPQFPLSRYIDGLTKVKVPNRDGEHTVTPGAGAGGRAAVSDYLGTPTCTNPLFASALPGVGDDPCNLPRGSRGKELVVFALIGGVRPSLVTGSPAWPAIVGANPATYDYSGQDAHMVQSILPRMGLPPPSSTRGDNGTDPVHGREWDTLGNDLQYACTFALTSAITCMATDVSCDCSSTSTNPPLCGPTLGAQLRAKAYPTIRELRVAEALGERAVVGSVCASNLGAAYLPTFATLSDRITPRLR